MILKRGSHWARSIIIWLLLSATGGAVVTELMETIHWLNGFWITTAFFAVTIGLLYGLFCLAGGGKSLAWLVILAFILRLGVGISLMKVLPALGYDTEQQNAGYVFFDAFRRDTQAVNLAGSEKPILSAFTQRYSTDQYGGYLASSIFIYRYLSPDAPRTHLLLILSAFAGAAAVPFFWMLTRRLWSDPFGKTASWIFVLFPQSILMGASQMREPWLILFLTLGIWSVIEWRKSESRTPLWGIAVSLVGFLFISPGLILLTVVFLAGWLFFEHRSKRIPVWVILLLAGVILVGLVAFAFALSNPQQFATNSPLEIIAKWFKNAIAWDMYLSAEGSGRLETLFKSFPTFLQYPFIVAYGVLQPVLPAALLDNAQWIWNVISSVLAAGWYFLLPLLIYTTFSLRGENDTRLRSQLTWMAALTWIWILICSARAGGDQWDNPRYRVIAIPWLAILATWGWNWAKSHQFRWMKLIWLVEGVFLLFFTQWYASRYYRLFGRLDLKVMLLLIGLISAGIILAGWITDRRQKPSSK